MTSDLILAVLFFFETALQLKWVKCYEPKEQNLCVNLIYLSARNTLFRFIVGKYSTKQNKLGNIRLVKLGRTPD